MWFRIHAVIGGFHLSGAANEAIIGAKILLKNYDLLGTGYICLDFLDWFLFTVVRSYFFLHLRNFSLNTKNAQIPARKDSSSWWPSPQPPPPSLPGRTVSGFKKFQPDLILPGHCTGWRAVQVIIPSDHGNILSSDFCCFWTSIGILGFSVFCSKNIGGGSSWTQKPPISLSGLYKFAPRYLHIKNTEKKRKSNFCK